MRIGADPQPSSGLISGASSIGGLDNPKAIAVEQNANIYVADEWSEPRIGKYTENGEHLFDLVLKGSMKNFRDLFVDGDGSVVVLQGDGVWKYSNVFARW